jgi:DNA invertase Pin-like site-specific DNA recombinase
MKRAVGYVCDIPVPDTGRVISRDDQRLRLVKYAKNENLDIVHIYEDEEYTDDFINNPGVQKILNGGDDFEVLLVERVWCLSRKTSELKPFLEKLDQKNIQMVMVSYLWDNASLGVRHYNLASRLRRAGRRPVDTNNFMDAA